MSLCQMIFHADVRLPHWASQVSESFVLLSTPSSPLFLSVERSGGLLFSFELRWLCVVGLAALLPALSNRLDAVAPAVRFLTSFQPAKLFFAP